MDTYIFVSVRSHERDHDHTLALEPDAGPVSSNRAHGIAKSNASHSISRYAVHPERASSSSREKGCSQPKSGLGYHPPTPILTSNTSNLATPI